MEYISGMKIKTSITLSEDLLEAIDKRSIEFKNRSEFIESALRAYIAKMIRDEQNAKDLSIINRQFERLNKEAADVLNYQVIPWNVVNSIASPTHQPGIQENTGYL